MPAPTLNPQLLDLPPLAALRLPTRALVTEPLVPVAGVDREIVQRRAGLFLEIGPTQRNRGVEAVVSCLMVTRNRPALAQLAVHSFRRQTWPHRELIVIDSSGTDELCRWVDSLGDPRIRVRFLPGSTKTLGEIRNLAVGEASGDYVCTWDDDDLYHPARLEVQVAALRNTNAQAAYLHREMTWSPRSRRMWITRHRSHENTMLCSKAVMPEYPSVTVGEDTAVTELLKRSQRIVLVDHPELYVYVRHGANTYTKRPGHSWQTASQRFEDEVYDQTLSKLSRCFPISDYLEILQAP